MPPSGRWIPCLPYLLVDGSVPKEGGFAHFQTRIHQGFVAESPASGSRTFTGVHLMDQVGIGARSLERLVHEGFASASVALGRQCEIDPVRTSVPQRFVLYEGTRFHVRSVRRNVFVHFFHAIGTQKPIGNFSTRSGIESPSRAVGENLGGTFVRFAFRKGGTIGRVSSGYGFVVRVFDDRFGGSCRRYGSTRRFSGRTLNVRGSGLHGEIRRNAQQKTCCHGNRHDDDRLLVHGA